MDKYKLVFNHDNMVRNEFKQRYDNRIKNLYSVLGDMNKHLYFIISTFEIISEDKINIFIKEICKYRESNSFNIIIINQSNQAKEYSIPNVSCIDLSRDTLFAKINVNGDWVDELKKMRIFNAALFNYKLNKKLSKIMRNK